jgi:hypothetical protein
MLRNASGTTEPSGSEAKLRVDLESQLTLQYVPGLVLVLVKVQRRAIVRCDDVLERSQGPVRLPPAHLESQRSAYGPLNRGAVAGPEQDHLSGRCHT